MNQIAVVYWSGTGNTEAMARAVAQGAESAGAAVTLKTVSEITAAEAASFPVLALGCPAMGDEVLEEGEFEPFFSELENSLSGKRVALFGSYGWGDGQWMRDWQDRVTGAGASLCGGEGLIVQNTPEADGLSQCEALGASLAKP